MMIMLISIPVCKSLYVHNTLCKLQIKKTSHNAPSDKLKLKLLVFIFKSTYATRYSVYNVMHQTKQKKDNDRCSVHVYIHNCVLVGSTNFAWHIRSVDYWFLQEHV